MMPPGNNLGRVVRRPRFAAWLGALWLLAEVCCQGEQTSYFQGYAPLAAGTITFCKQIAPIIYENCSTCHRPGQSGPFALLNYSDVSRHAATINDRVSRRAMPPWQPEPGYNEFEGQRRLSVAQIGMIQQWVSEGAKEGDPADLPPQPVWTEGWQLGPPDLVLKAPQPYLLEAEGKDVYRNLVIPSGATHDLYVRAMELHPGNRAVHHAFVLEDPTKLSRLKIAKNFATGLAGMELPDTAATPQGHFLGWQPGRAPYQPREGMAWVLQKGADLIVQLHMNPSGKPELVQPEIGLYFTPQPPTHLLQKILLTATDFEIPAGTADFELIDSYRLPVEVTLLAINPHAHNLGKSLSGYAILPDGSRKELILIKHWDFAWQGDYRLKNPLTLPKGTVLHMEYTYDNSEANPRNPHHPPITVRYGPQTVDEMAELWLQVTTGPAEMAILAKDISARVLQAGLGSYRYRLRQNPNDAVALSEIGFSKIMAGATNAGVADLRAAILADPALDKPHYYLGVVLRMQDQMIAAREEFQRAVQLNPDSYKAYGNLGLIAQQEGKQEKAARYFQRALAINPEDPLARAGLQEAGQTH